MSPTSLKLTQRALEYGSKHSLNDSLKMEFRMIVHLLDKDSSDFYEGVRALLVDKDQKPKWNPTQVDEVSNEKVENYFKSLINIEELKL